MVTWTDGLSPGGRVAGYQLLEQAGRGGMAVVFRAHDSRLNRTVALKILAPALAADAAFRARFIRESHAASAIDDPHIIPVYEAGEADGVLFIAMRFVDGDARSLLIRNGPLQPPRAAEIISQVASALDTAHRSGLVHRDVKASNILLDTTTSTGERSDFAYLSDFGLSKGFLDSDAGLTATGQFLGTVDYAAPEQIQGKLIDGRTDQYALACTAFELLTGSPPFRRDGAMAALLAHVQEPPPTLSSLRPGIPAPADDVLARALAKDPAERYSSCGDFAGALRAAIGQRAEYETPLTSGAVAGIPRPEAVIVRPTESETESAIIVAVGRDAGAAPTAIHSVITGVPLSPAAADAGDSAPVLLLPARTLDLRLKPTFRYIHEPFTLEPDVLPSLGNEVLIAELKSRIKHSRGGSFLVTGFRGVGKSTLVLRMLEQLVAENRHGDVVVPVTLSVARTTTTERLLFAVVRRIFETLRDCGALDSMPPDTRDALLVAYMRTSLSFKETQSEARDRSIAMNVGVSPGKAFGNMLSVVTPSLTMRADRNKSLATEATFLAYSETDAEYDLTRIVSLVSNSAGSAPRRPWWRVRAWRKQSAGPKVHLVVILDEIDKLTASQTGLAAVEELLNGIKNVLTMPGGHFVLVAGPDMHDRALRDAARGNSIYESVFGWSMYVPCSWDAPDLLIDGLVVSDENIDPGLVDLLKKYLRFKSRGLPRRLLQEVNRFVVWDRDEPHLRVSGNDLRRAEFYAQLEDIVNDYFRATGHDELFYVAIDEDRWRLGAYYIIDWVLNSAAEPFSVTDLERDGDEADFDPSLRLSRRNASHLLDHLTKAGIIELVHEMGPTATIYADVAESRAKVFRLSADVQQRLRGFAANGGTERELSQGRWYAGSAGPYSGSGQVLAGRYMLENLLSQGGIASIYRGRDLATERDVAIKLLRTSLEADSVARARIAREAEIAKDLDHPHIIRTYDVISTPRHGTAIIAELLRGPDLESAVASGDAIAPSDVASIGHQLAEVLCYLERRRIVRIGLKPGNVVMTRRGPVISDLGVASRLTDDGALTDDGPFIGTPAYMAPELLEGRGADSRADQYALALLLFHCLTGGSSQKEPHTPTVILEARARELDLAALSISPEFRSVLAKALERKPDERFRDSAALRDAIKATPEWQSYRSATTVTVIRPKPSRKSTP